MQLGTSKERLDTSLADVVELLRKHDVLETLIHRQASARRDLLEHLQRQQNLVELQARCRKLHPSDLAYILEALPLDSRHIVWEQLAPPLKGQVLAEVASPVRDWLIERTPAPLLVESLRGLDPDDLAALEGAVETDVWRQVSDGLGSRALTRLQEVSGFAEDVVGHAMSADFVAVREPTTVRDVLADLSGRAAPLLIVDHIFVVDVRGVLRGVVPVMALVASEPETPVSSVFASDPVVFDVNDEMDTAVRAFERYGTSLAPVIDARGRIAGALASPAILSYVRSASDRAALAAAGLGRDEDLFAPVFDSARNRWPWLFINLITAFLASRVIGQFEGIIAQLVALATLMPIVASVGGNTGNQTVALVIRGLALDQLRAGTYAHLMRKELIVSLLNGLLWGSVIGVFAVALYGNWALGLVMMSAVFLNLLVAAVVGVAVPIALQRLGRDPAQGSSVLLTFATDSMGFFIFLGLAHVFLR